MMADNDAHMKAHREQGTFNLKAAINQVAANCCREGAKNFAQGAIDGCVAELIFLMGEREAFEFMMNKAEAIIRSPEPAGKIWTPPAKG